MSHVIMPAVVCGVSRVICSVPCAVCRVQLYRYGPASVSGGLAPSGPFLGAQLASEIAETAEVTAAIHGLEQPAAPGPTEQEWQIRR